MDKAEINQAGDWQPISASDARLARQSKFRCADCHGLVYVMGSYMQGALFRFTHRRSFPGCGGSIGGVPQRHPNSIA